jgi:hypothetical protein
MVSLSKILTTILVIVAIWYGFRWLKRLAERERPRPRPRGGPPKDIRPIEDLIACGVCGDYAPSGAAACGRADCPRR